MKRKHMDMESFFARLAELLRAQKITPMGKIGVLPDGREVHYSWVMAAAGIVSLGVAETIGEALDDILQVPPAELGSPFHFADPEMKRDPVADRHALQTWNSYRRRMAEVR